MRKLAFKPNDREVVLGAIQNMMLEARQGMWNGDQKLSEEFHKLRNIADLFYQVIGGEHER